ncbi:HAD family hydrolase [Vreelandella lutescens]|uniref:phosphoglycolate phosphatase n=1 Tax=Vreelandella lutescens TaxID=1602943 RepID=A0ABQ1PCT7_9GAMM|nr:HAD family phosphatase [Halomonas lutescens]GGC94679.1 phosphatase [Halomonas lutescens]
MPQLIVQGVTYDIDAILFDKDGTLLNFGDLWIGWFDQLVTTVNRRLPVSQSLSHRELYPKVGIYSEQRLWDPTGPLTIGSLNDIATIVALALFEARVPWNEATEITQDALHSVSDTIDWPRCVTPVKGLQAFVARASRAGIKLGVVTSDDYHNATRHLSLLSLTHNFPVVLGHDQVDRGKPFPDMALVACQQLGVSPERTLIIGDSNGDMAMGKAAGLLAGIGICAAPHLDGEHLTLASHVIRDYDTLAIGSPHH